MKKVALCDSRLGASCGRRNEAGVEAREDRGYVDAGLMQSRNQRRHARRHHQEIAEPARSGVPPGVGNTTGHENRRAGRHLEHLVAATKRERALEDVPRLIVPVVAVQRRHRVVCRRLAVVDPFGEDEVLAVQLPAAQGRDAHRHTIVVASLRLT